MPNYRLINPYIEGTLSNTYSGNTPLAAADNLWNSIVKYITNPVPKFPFTMENVQDGTLHHFIVKETLSKNNTTNYKINPLDIKLKKSETENFKSKANKMKGGMTIFIEEEDDDDSDDYDLDDEEDEVLDAIFKKAKSKKEKHLLQQPITYWWYDPLIYQVDSIFIPTFVNPLTPYIEVATINYYP